MSDTITYHPFPGIAGELEQLQVGSAITGPTGENIPSLRAHVRRAIENGDIKQPLTGVQIAGLNKASCIRLLTGDALPADVVSAPAPSENGANGAHATLESERSAPVPAVDASRAKDAVAEAMATLAKAFGGNVNEEQIKQQVLELTAPHIGNLEELNRRLERQEREQAETFHVALSEMQSEAEKAREIMLAGRALKLEITVANGAPQNMGRQHFMFPGLLACIAARVHAFLVGPAGGFKTTAAHKAAEACGLAYYSTSVCQQTTKSDLLGYMDATGHYVTTQFRRAYEGGGVFLLDEADAGNANVLAVLNAALSNGMMGFPDGMIARHADFVFVASGNTWGTGADAQFVGRNQLDAATLDRFAFIRWDYDNGMEAEIVGIEGVASPHFDMEAGGRVDVSEWFTYVQGVRAAIASFNGHVRAIVSPRATFMGAALARLEIAANGGKTYVGRYHLENWLLWKGLPAETVSRIKTAIPAPGNW
jgi:cobaltochelatase CobS